MAQLYDPSEGFRSDLNTLAQSFIAGMQAKQQKAQAEQELAFKQQEANLAAQREERLAKAEEARSAMEAYSTLGKGITEGYTIPERADIVYRQIAPKLYPETITQKPVSEILPTQELPPAARPPMQEPRTAEQTQALQQLQVINDRLSSVDQLPVPEEIKTNLRNYLTDERERTRALALGEPSAVQELPTAPRGGGFVGARPQQIRGAGAVEQRQPAPALFGAPSTKKESLPLIKEAFQTVTKLLENGDIQEEEGSRFMTSLSAFMKSGNIEDLVIPTQIGENVSKKEKLFLENLKLRQQIIQSKAATELMRARAAQVAKGSTQAGLLEIANKAAARSWGTRRAEAEQFLVDVKPMVGSIGRVFQMREGLPPEFTGPFAGRTRGKYEEFARNPQVATFLAERSGLAAGIARFLGEKGALHEGDIERATILIPDLADTAEGAERKKHELMQLISDRVKEKQDMMQSGVPGTTTAPTISLPPVVGRGAAPKGKETPAGLPPPAISPGTQPKPSDPATTKYLQENFPHLYQGTSPSPIQAPPGASVAPPAETEPTALEESQADEIERLREEMEANADDAAVFRALSGEE